VALDTTPEQRTLIVKAAAAVAEPRATAIVTVILLLGALSIHGFFDGMIIGTLPSGGSITVLIAVVSHKPLESLSLGTVMIRGNTSLRVYLACISALSLVTVAGVAVGMVVSSLEAAGLTVPVFYALAVGSFLYISTTEIVAEEISRNREPRDAYFKFCAFLLGLAFIVALNAILPHEHEEGHLNMTRTTL